MTLRVIGASVVMAIAASTVMAACGNDVQSGLVVAKSTEAAHTYQVEVCDWYGKYGCAWYGTETKTEPPHWYLALQDPKNPNHISAHSVTPRQYARYQDGQQFP